MERVVTGLAAWVAAGVLGVGAASAQPASHVVPRASLGLIGVTQIGSRTEAWLVDRSNQQRETVRPGQTAFGYTVKRVGGDSVVLSRGGREFTLRLDDRPVVSVIPSRASRSRLHARRRTGAGTTANAAERSPAAVDEPNDTDVADTAAPAPQPAARAVGATPRYSDGYYGAPGNYGYYGPGAVDVAPAGVYPPGAYPPGWSIFPPANGYAAYPPYSGPYPNGMGYPAGLPGGVNGLDNPYSPVVPGVVPGAEAYTPGVSPVLTPYSGPTPFDPTGSAAPYGGFSGTAPYGRQTWAPPSNWWGGSQTFQDTLGVGGNPQTARRSLGVGTRGGAYNSPAPLATPQTMRRRGVR